MAIKIPEELKADVPQTTWGKVLSATPIVMTVVATMLAGLASSEMTRAQYDRALAAQQQSKAGDQWGFFQAKRLRGAVQHNALDILQATTDTRPLRGATLGKSIAELPVPSGLAAAEEIRKDTLTVLDSVEGKKALAVLEKGELPGEVSAPTMDPKLKGAIEAVEGFKSDAEMAATLALVDDQAITAAIHATRDKTLELDALLQPISQTIDTLEKLLSRQMAVLGASGGPGEALVRSLNRDFTAARLRYTGLRYEAEARLNQRIANLMELPVRKNNFTAERHHNRSQQFFFGMLGAQMAVIISTFAVAARKRNLLWSLAAAAGLAAIVFAIYVYVYL